MTWRIEVTKTVPIAEDSPKKRLQPVVDVGAIVVASAELGKKRAQHRKKDAEEPLYIKRI